MRMVNTWWVTSILLVVSQIASSSGISLHDQTTSAPCTIKTQRKPWQNLTSLEKAGYINATLCLMNKPSKIDIPVAKTRWDDFQYAHAYNMPYVHGVGAFLPFHRYFITVHERVLRDECNYSGSMPYWDEPLDVQNFTLSPIFDPLTGFGGNGTSPDLCVIDGPFAHLTIHIATNLSSSNYCLTRNFNPCLFKTAAQKYVDKCMSLPNFEQARNCIEQGPHGSGHAGVGALMLDVSVSPGDPLFWLHHTYLDKLWWQWQSLNLSARLTDMSGSNIQTFPSLNGTFPGFPGGNFTGNSSVPFPIDPTCPNAFSLPPNATLTFPMPAPPNLALINYFDDGGNVTTLNHVLNSVGIMGNVTIRDVMDIRGDFVCAEYL